MFKKEVQAGIAVLDKHYGGRGWVQQVNWDVLDMRFSDKCILGQLFGSYWDGADSLNIDGSSCGFDLTTKYFDCWNALEAAWKSALDIKTEESK